MDMVNELRMRAEDLHSVSGTNKYATAMSLAADQIERLRRDCAEAYQVVGTISGVLWDNKNVRMDDVTKALNNLLAAANGEPRPHENLLPFSATHSEFRDTDG